MGRRVLFGPVPSRRLGRSLGIDLLARKTCTLDCVYCECGPTEALTLERKEYVPTQDVLDELDAFLAGRPALDSITFSGSGEPTLHLGIGKIIHYIKDNYPEYPVTVLTNGTLLTDPAVRAELVRADRVVPSLDAVSDAAFTAVNRPVPGLDNAAVIEGLVRFREEYHQQLWLEFFLVPGQNDAPDELAAIAAAAARIRPDRVQLNTVARPPAEPDARAVSLDELDALAELIPGFVEVIADHPLPASNTEGRGSADLVLDLLRRRPCTLQDIAAGLDMHPNEVLKYTDRLVREGLVEHQEVAGRNYYSAPSTGDSA